MEHPGVARGLLRRVCLPTTSVGRASVSNVVESSRQSKHGPARGWLVRVLALLLTVQAFHAATHALSHRIAPRGVVDDLSSFDAAGDARQARTAVSLGQAAPHRHGSAGMPVEGSDAACLLCAVLGHAGHAVQSSVDIAVASNHAAAPPPEPLGGIVPMVMVAYPSRGPPVIARLDTSS